MLIPWHPEPKDPALPHSTAPSVHKCSWGKFHGQWAHIGSLLPVEKWMKCIIMTKAEKVQRDFEKVKGISL